MSLDESRCKAIAALLAEPTKKAAAKKAGISESTIRRYCNEPEFRLELARQTDHIVMDACTSAALAAAHALMVLSDISSNGREPTAQRIAASKIILDYTLKSAVLLPSQRESELHPTNPIDIYFANDDVNDVF
jgi:hypothetical protein